MTNPVELIQLNNAAIAARDNGRLGTARVLYEQMLSKAGTDTFCRSLASSSLGMLHWGEYGDGIEAKAKFEATMADCDSLSQGGNSKLQVPIRSQMACAAENLMLLAVSYEEFEKWTEQLRSIAPGETILEQLVPLVREQRDIGASWAEQMVRRALSYINVGHFGTAAHPASGACICSLVLSKRKALRLQTKEWNTAVSVYFAAICEICDKAEHRIRASGGNPYTELAGVGRFLLPFTKDYCDAHPGDKSIAKLLDNARMLSDKYSSEREIPPAATQISNQNSRQFRTHPGVLECLTSILLLGGGLLPFVWGAATGWKIVGGFLTALGVLFVLALGGKYYHLRQSSRTRASTANRK